MNSPINLRFSCSYYENDKTLYCGHNAGFFSNCSVTFWAIEELLNQGIVPEVINFSRSFDNYRDEGQEGIDLYSSYFCLDYTQDINHLISSRIKIQNHHGIYKNYNFADYNPLMARYFKPNQSILEIEHNIVQNYDIDYSKTIVVFYRGTDKGYEAKLIDPKYYLKEAEKILNRNPDFKILIQTDQKQVRDLLSNYFQKNCFFLEEMPVTSGKTALHLQDLNISKFEFGQRILAVTYLMSKCKFIINHTGNMASWLCLFRGNANNMFQFSRQGHLITDWNKMYYTVVEKFSKPKRESFDF
jgi:hypothetical protein